MKRERKIIDTELIEPRRRPLEEPQRLAFSRRGMIATQHDGATRAGVRLLEGGGNAVDAAVAAAFALGVCEPQASGLGGQTMVMLHLADSKRTFLLDGSSRAPNRAAPATLKASQRRRGHKSATVPSTPAVLAYALERYGTRTLGEILEPAIEMAEDGVVVSELLHSLTRREIKKLRGGPAAEIFLKNGRSPRPVGTVLTQPALARTLKRLRDAGIEDFYSGEIAHAIHADMERNQGLIRDDDLAQIPWPIERKPVTTRFRSVRLATCPPPGAGRVLIEMLHILENIPEKLWDVDSPEGALLLARIIRRAALDRVDRPYDPNFYAQVEGKRLIRRDYARGVADKLRRGLKTTGETTHLSAMDAEGNAVALTQSIEAVYGSGAASPELGFLYNNYMSAFEYDDIGHPYYMRPNAVPWASVAPTIVFRGPRAWMSIGSPGSQRIVSAILQVLLRLRQQSPYDAVAAPRLHCSVDDRVSLEAPRFRSDIPAELERHGFEVDRRDAFSFYLGCVQLVMRDRKGFTGVADPRRDGSAGGPAS